MVLVILWSWQTTLAYYSMVDYVFLKRQIIEASEEIDRSKGVTNAVLRHESLYVPLVAICEQGNLCSHKHYY